MMGVEAPALYVAEVLGNGSSVWVAGLPGCPASVVLLSGRFSSVPTEDDDRLVAVPAAERPDSPPTHIGVRNEYLTFQRLGSSRGSFVDENVEFPLMVRDTVSREGQQQVQKALDEIEMEPSRAPF